MPETRTRSAWEREHSAELDRVDALDRRISWKADIERVVNRGVERNLERELEL